MRKVIIAAVILILLAGSGIGGWHWLQSTRQPTEPQIPAGTERVNPKDGAAMVWVQAGTFSMGKDKQTLPSPYSYPKHKVYLDGYWIYKTEVTVAQYRQFAYETGRRMPTEPVWGWNDNHPVVGVRWEDAASYARWANAALPTEAQWEKAARGTDERIYPWGNDWDPQKLQCSTSELPVTRRDKSKLEPNDRTAPVGSFPAGASPYGCLDLAGNAMEWCADWYDKHYYFDSPFKNPTGPKSSLNNIHVSRGGSWYLQGDPKVFMSTNRGGVDFISIALPSEVFGFRCVVILPEK